MLELSREYDCAIRFPFTGQIPGELEATYPSVRGLLQEFNPARPDHFIVDFYDEGATYKDLLEILNHLPDGTSELMCHPGYVDDGFSSESVYNRQRERELEILTDPSIKAAITASGIELITFAEL
jgi:predicted glycoside hydrolase/deacetylase ChbG (UPF0249 family)